MSTDHALLVQLLGKVKSGELVLPSLPEVAIGVREMARQPDCSLSELSAEISKDPALAARIVSLSNSAAFGGVSKSTSVIAAVTRLGLHRTRDLAVAAAMQQLFRTSRSMTWDLMDEIWRFNVEVASCASAILACQHELGNLHALSADTLLLASLIHNIGALPVLEQAELKPELFAEREQLRRITQLLKAPIGRSVLLEWGFDQELIEVVHRWADFSFQTQEVGYLDLVRLAAIYSREVVLADPFPSVLEMFVSKGVIPSLDLFGMETYFLTYNEIKASFDSGPGYRRTG
ncbi:HDOD domain-containing protein [Ferrimonas balearica]|uniref:HDOD domain-containing protein n=1 Tax=Ferrimonas balearica TaxID=44012 RepID=UPI001C951478|nr:HDOD domain-containing protein [Ferrimonas balearica]MBY6224962.1 HDOD domain-containing protein [Ferrimonas balearica]